MSKVAIQGNASGTGTFTIAAPNSNTDRTLTLPDNAGTMLSSTSDLTPQVKTSTSATGDAPIFAARAWVNFSGTTSPGTIRASGNVSSVTRLGAGNFRINFTTAMPDANYSTAGSAGGEITTNATSRVVSTLNAGRLVGSVEIDVHTQNASGANSSTTNSENINVSVFR